jgi:hypothetical protein
MTCIGCNTWSYVILHHYQRINYGDSTDHAWNTVNNIYRRPWYSRELSHGKAQSNHTMMLLPYAPRSRGGSKENYRSFSITFLGQGIASLLHDKTPSGFPVVLSDLFSESPVARRTCLIIFVHYKEHFVPLKLSFESS